MELAEQLATEELDLIIAKAALFDEFLSICDNAMPMKLMEEIGALNVKGRLLPMSEALKYIRAHQYLYYIEARPVITDHDYDMWGSKNCKADYKGGSDCEADYNDEIKQLARAIYDRKIPTFPF